MCGFRYDSSTQHVCGSAATNTSRHDLTSTRIHAHTHTHTRPATADKGKGAPTPQPETVSTHRDVTAERQQRRRRHGQSTEIPARPPVPGAQTSSRLRLVQGSYTYSVVTCGAFVLEAMCFFFRLSRSANQSHAARFGCACETERTCLSKQAIGFHKSKPRPCRR